jgi:hypothetical protein
MAHNARSGGGGTVRPARWHHGGATKAHQSSVLQGYGAPFWWFLFLRNWWSVRKSPRVSSTGRGLQSRTCGGKVQASTFDDDGGMLQGSAHDKVGPNGWSVEHRTPVSSWWSSRSIARGVAMKGVNLGIVSVFLKIPTQKPSIYRGFRLIISYSSRALSPSFAIRVGFDFWPVSLRFWSVALLARWRSGTG